MKSKITMKFFEIIYIQVTIVLELPCEMNSWVFSGIIIFASFLILILYKGTYILPIPAQKLY